jgi:hypothetical protein
MNPNLKDLANKTKNPDVSLDDKVDPQYIYVPELDLTVSKKVEYMDHNFKQIKEIQQQKNAKILTPSQWWVLWDNYPELFQKTPEWEHVDAYSVDRKDLVVGPKLLDGDLIGGKRYDDALIIVSDLLLDFSREDVDEKTGLPTRFERGLNRYQAPKADFAPMVFGGRIFPEELDHAVIDFSDASTENWLTGVRLCYEGKR